ncbi:MAG: hypothetical protein ACR2KO_17045 [Geodermatophilaceae bacterium]
MSDRDELRGRMRDLVRQAEQTSAPGLADVLHRRDRRQRNTVLASTLAVVAVLGSTALFLNPFGDNPSIQPLGPGTSVTSEATTTVSGPQPTADPGQPTNDTSQSGAATPPSSAGGSTSQTSQSSETATSVPPTEPADSLLTIDFGSLVTVDELQAAGVAAVESDAGDDGQPTVPPMCTASSWQEQYSGPSDFVSDTYSLGFGLLYIDLLSYPSAAEANLALVKLKEDARACPTVNEFLTVEVTAVGSAIGDEFVIFRMDSEDGDSGEILPIWVTIARTDNVLVAAAVTEDHIGRYTSGNEQITRDAAAANVEHLQAT